MISKEAIEEVKRRTFAEAAKHKGLPANEQTELAYNEGQRLASQLKADVGVVALGCLLMDYKLGQAYSEGRLSEHISMSEVEADSALAEFPDITSEEKRSIKDCIHEHHGVQKFSSLESEICCNADCYKFASVRGFIVSLRYTRDMPLIDLLKLLTAKTEEKWKTLSLEICRQELKPDYKAIKNLLAFPK